MEQAQEKLLAELQVWSDENLKRIKEALTLLLIHMPEDQSLQAMQTRLAKSLQ
jgi:hypothetical protein